VRHADADTDHGGSSVSKSFGAVPAAGKMPLMPGLIMRKGPSPGVRFSLEGKLILGRHRNADVVIQDLGASRRHAAVIARGGAFRVLDLGSTNGTYLNGRPIHGEEALQDGDRIRIGEEEFEFVLHDSSSGGTATSSLETAPLERRSGGVPTPFENGEDLPRDLGKFILLEHLGRGGMGDVYRARERAGGPMLAIKLIRSEIGRRESFLDYFHNREAVFAREIDHPNIIRIFEHGVIANRHFIAMEYVPGESLQERIARGPIPFDEALEILRQVACGLSAAHRRGVVHSDIKPGNILIFRGSGAPSGPNGSEATGDGREGEVVLEFPGVSGDLGGATLRLDGALREEIRRRAGDPQQDILLDPPYFARPSETQFLLHYWETLRDGGGHLLLVTGEPGAGRKRLLSEFVKDLGLEGTIPGVFVTPPARLIELDVSRVEGIPLLYQRLFPDRAPIEHPSRESIDEIVQVFEASEEPTVVRVLSFEEATPLACELLQGLLRILPRKQILMIATIDPERSARHSTLKSMLASAGNRVKELYLRPLTAYQIGRFLQELFREPLRQDLLADDLHRLSGGNFSRLLEAVRGLFEKGLLRFDRPAGRVVYQRSLRDLELEEGKQFYDRYRAFGKMQRQVVEHAAFIGPDFLFDTLQKFCEIDETALFFIVRDLLSQGFVTEPSRTWYRFTNEAFQRYVAGLVPPRDRSRLHQRVAWLLDEAPIGPSPDLWRLRAFHWERAGEPGKAVHLLLEGAHLARNRYEVDLARQMYQEILRVYRSLAADESKRRAVTSELRSWFHREANWYEVLGSLGEEQVEVRVKITDFGISFKMQAEDGFNIDQRVPLGTPRYLAPERVRREVGGPKADIFALGVIAYEMIAGIPPFPGLKGIDVMKANLTREIPVPAPPSESAPAEFAALFHGMVEPDPDLRWDAERVLRTVGKMQFEKRLKGNA